MRVEARPDLNPSHLVRVQIRLVPKRRPAMDSFANGDEDHAASGLATPYTHPPPTSIVVTEESTRRGFHKLWTDADEIAMLQGFWEFTSRRGTAQADYQHDTGNFYDEIRVCLRLDFSRIQLVEKLRRLKKKYRSTAGRMAADKGFAFRSPHERAIFEIARKIWKPSFKRGRDAVDLCGVKAPKHGILDSDAESDPRSRRRPKNEKGIDATETFAAASATAAVNPQPMPEADMVEETLRSCLTPLFNEVIRCAGIGHGVASSNQTLNPLLLNSRTMAGAAVDEKWKQQQILELEVYLKRLDLVHEHIKLKLEELKSKGRR